MEPSVYVRVKFTSAFANPHKTIPDQYQPRTRLADIQVRKEGNQWKPLIASIAFFSSETSFETESYQLETPGLGGAGQRVDDPDARGSSEMKAEILAELKKEFERMTQAENARKANTAQKLLAEGDASFNDGAFESALRAYQQAMRVNPYDTEAFKRINKAQEAIEREKRNKEKRQIQLQDHLRAGRAAYRFRQYDLAQKSYQAALDINPRMDSVREKIRVIERRVIELSKLEIKAKQNDLSGALKDYSRSLKVQPNDVDLLVRRGLTYEKLERPKKAMDDYTRALELYPDYHKAYVRRGFLYEASQDLRLAEADYSPGIVPAPACSRPWLFWGAPAF
ncbi:MAG: tetratricopeptide repeat protein, partial [Bacteroidota bacterium]